MEVTHDKWKTGGRTRYTYLFFVPPSAKRFGPRETAATHLPAKARAAERAGTWRRVGAEGRESTRSDRRERAGGRMARQAKRRRDSARFAPPGQPARSIPA